MKTYTCAGDASTSDVPLGQLEFVEPLEPRSTIFVAVTAGPVSTSLTGTTGDVPDHIRPKAGAP
ncbi:hypothetical protein ACLBXO_24840 [Methylobacterium sp. C33D]